MEMTTQKKYPTHWNWSKDFLDVLYLGCACYLSVNSITEALKCTTGIERSVLWLQLAKVTGCRKGWASAASAATAVSQGGQG